MRKFHSGNLPIILSGLILFMLACTPESCFEETESFLKVSFYSYITQNPLAPDSVTIYGLNRDTNLLYNKTTKVQVALLPLNTETGSCVFIIRLNGISDSVEFGYTSYPHLLSKECGYTFYHNLTPDSLTYSTNAIDLIEIKKSKITTINEENIRIFY